MKILGTILSTMTGALLGFAAAGLGSALLLTSTFGQRDGGPGMTGFFYFGPLGAVAGALLALGFMVRLFPRSSSWSVGLLVAAGVVALFGSILFGVVISGSRGSSYSEVIEFELEYPAAALAAIPIPSAHALWGAAGDTLDDTPISQFSEKQCRENVCVLPGAVAAQGPTNNFRISTLIGTSKHQYSISLPAVISGPVDWSAWRAGNEARIRWRIVKR